ncbi:MAG: response regulator [Nitrospirales bacterium]|nr:response regulator [Nitrospirales bacterium]
MSGHTVTISKSILVVEDSPAQCELLSQALAQHGFEEALHIEHGIAPALTYLSHQLEDRAPLPRLILVDLKLMSGSGIDIVRDMRRHKRLHLVPVVILTTSDVQHDIDAAYISGANGYVVKPGTYSDLVKLMGDLCRFWLGWNRTA